MLPWVSEVVIVITGVVVGVATEPWNPLAVATVTLVTVPVPDPGVDNRDATEDVPKTVWVGAAEAPFLAWDMSLWTKRKTRFISSTVRSWTR
jgi:hypothetical protein